ncbi:hypothetical protein D3C77_748060 [compost metagenome]
MVTLISECSCSPMASSTKATPPALGLSRYLKGEPCWLCLARVKRVPSRKLKIPTGFSRNLAQVRRVVSRSLPCFSGCLAR